MEKAHTHMHTRVELWPWGPRRGDGKQAAAASRGWTEGLDVGSEFCCCKCGEWPEDQGGVPLPGSQASSTLFTRPGCPDLGATSQGGVASGIPGAESG